MIDGADMGVFFSDLATTVKAVTWGETILGIFDREYVEAEGHAGEMPTLLVQRSDVPASYDTGDAFKIGSDSYTLVDVQYAEPGVMRLVLAG